jgi:hypothetical protein
MEKKLYEIKLKLKDFRQFFNSLDPSPFLERDLDDDASEYIVESVKDFPIKRPMRIVILLPKEQVNQELKDNIQAAIRHFFSYKLESTSRRLRKHLEKGRKAFFIGIIFLTLALTLSQLISQKFTGFFSRIVSEGLDIAGWVALWEPISIFLYDWWPITKDRKIFEKLKNMKAIIKPLP